MSKKGLIQKLKTGIAGLGLIGLTYFNPADAQTQIKKNYQPKYNTTTHYIIKEIQKESPYINLKTLDNVIDESKKIVKENYKGDPYNTKEAKQLMEKIGNLIYRQFPEAEETHPCYTRSLAYLAVSEINKLPIRMVLVPNHLFLRWDPDGMHKQTSYSQKGVPEEAKDYLTIEKNPSSNAGDFNWDPNFLKSIEDLNYEYLFTKEVAFRDKEIEEGIYLKNLNKNELLSVVYAEESFHLFEKGFYDKALKNANKSLELNSKNIIGYHSKGKILYQMGKDCSENCEKYFEESIENYKKAKELSCSWASAQEKYSVEIGWNLKSLGKYEEAENKFNEALGKIIRKEDSWIVLERLGFYLLTNQNEKAKKDFIRFSNLEGTRITEHHGKAMYIFPNKYMDQGKLIGHNWLYAEIKCKSLDTLGWEWRLPSIEELESIYKTQDETGFEFAQLWSSTEDKNGKMLVKDMRTGKVHSVEKKLNLYEREWISSVCVKTMEDWNIEEMLLEEKNTLLKINR